MRLVSFEQQIGEFRASFDALRSEIAKVIVGQEQVVEQLLTCILADGHALLEGVPGIGKTKLARTLAHCLALTYSRIQFTPDLMPADVIGTDMIVEDPDGRKQFRFRKGPVFGNLILADEINRATPKTQSALLEAMQERAVTVGGERHELEPPFLVVATQNPIEMEGTYPLPEAQLDRFFFKILVPEPDEDTLVGIVEATTGESVGEPQPVLDGPGVLGLRDLVRQVPVAQPLVRYAARLVRATAPACEHASTAARRYLRYGAGVRGAQALILAAKVRALRQGRANVAFEDLRAVAHPALRHRLLLNFEGEAEGIAPDAVIDNVLEEVADLPPELAKLD